MEAVLLLVMLVMIATVSVMIWDRLIVLSNRMEIIRDRQDRDAHYLGAMVQAVINQLKASKRREVYMAGELADLISTVTANTDVVNSAVTVINDLIARLDAAIAAEDWNTVKTLSDTIKANTDALAAAIANVPPVAPA